METEVKKAYFAYKELGETPLEALERLRRAEGIPDSVPMTYAGRLDPAAEGALVILAGEECRNKLAYTSLPKTYVAEVLLGVSTDSYDLLGIPGGASFGADFEMTVQATGDLFTGAEAFVKSQIGRRIQKYPPYSSKAVAGIQLHARAREGKPAELPTHEVELYAYDDLAVLPKRREEIVARVALLAEKVTGDFRQKEILASWKKLAETMPERLPALSVTIQVGSGFYVRQLAEDIGRALGTGACLYSLVRTRVGEHA